MAANAFEKTTRNRTLSDTGRGAFPSTTHDNWTFRVEINSSDKLLLRSFFGQEVNFYNALVEGLSARLRSFPDALLALTGPWADLFVDLAETAYPVRRLPTKAADLPPRLAQHRHTLYDDKGNWRTMSERTTMILELAGAKGNIHPLARRAMAQEMIHFYRQQAQVTTASVPVHLREEQVYKTPPESLETIDPARKRHVQLPRDAVTMRFDEKNNRTTLYVPYAKEGIAVNGDLTKPQSWNVMIIRQTQHDRASNRSAWQIEVRKSPNNYFIKMFDSNRSAFGK